LKRDVVAAVPVLLVLIEVFWESKALWVERMEQLNNFRQQTEPGRIQFKFLFLKFTDAENLLK